jgi:hypothetical protein
MNSHPQPLEGTMPSNIFFFFCSTGVWTQNLHLQPLYQSFSCWVFLR